MKPRVPHIWKRFAGMAALCALIVWLPESHFALQRGPESCVVGDAGILPG